MHWQLELFECQRMQARQNLLPVKKPTCSLRCQAARLGWANDSFDLHSFRIEPDNDDTGCNRCIFMSRDGQTDILWVPRETVEQFYAISESEQEHCERWRNQNDRWRN